jgi:hypothetical protein
MIKLTVIFLIITLFSCRNSKDFRSDLEGHKFDQTVIQNLPLYDTFRQIIIENYDSFHLSKTNYRFTYIYNFDTSTKRNGYSNTDIPNIIYSQTVQLFERIGRDNLLGFTVFQDSTVHFFIRDTHLSKYFLDVRERLDWYPTSRKIFKTEFPFKDTILGEQWQYQIWYDKRAEFF